MYDSAVEARICVQHLSVVKVILLEDIAGQWRMHRLNGSERIGLLTPTRHRPSAT
jgi:hypothetical protein